MILYNPETEKAFFLPSGECPASLMLVGSEPISKQQLIELISSENGNSICLLVFVPAEVLVEKLASTRLAAERERV